MLKRLGAIWRLTRMKGVAQEGGPSVLEWWIAVFACVVQQGAFISIPLYFGTTALSIREEQNELNTIAVGISLLSILAVSIVHGRAIAQLAFRNLTSVAFLLLVLASAFWSIHPDLSVRRGVGYILTVLVAAFIAIRFDTVDRMKVLSFSFAISAFGSLLFVVIFPSSGIMGVGELAGNWRGVFTHKNVLGPTMAVGVFVELFILCAGHAARWRYGLLSILVFLVVMSHSATALILSALYGGGAIVYAIGKRFALAGTIVSIVGFLILIGASLIVYLDTQGVLEVLGKDSTLTGRTAVWHIVSGLIGERPIFGYGYRAMWVLNDASTTLADQAVGGWGVGSSHNGFLEIALQLGYVGVGVILMILTVAFVRALKVWLSVSGPLGFFSLVFLTGTLLGAQTMETMGQNQVIEWVVFNILLYGCGLASSPRRSRRALPAHGKVIYQRSGA